MNRRADAIVEMILNAGYGVPDSARDAITEMAEEAADLLDTLQGLVNGLADKELTAINAGYARAAISKARNNQR